MERVLCTAYLLRIVDWTEELSFSQDKRLDMCFPNVRKKLSSDNVFGLRVVFHRNEKEGPVTVK